MIKNELQYSITKKWAGKFADALQALGQFDEGQGMDPLEPTGSR